MNFLTECTEKVTVERGDGSRHEDVSALVTGEMILIPDVAIPIALGDAILRSLPSGLVDRLIVTEPGLYSKIRGIPAHYQVKYSREGQQADGTAGYVIHVQGSNARVNIQSTDNSSNVTTYQINDMRAFADELGQLRDALLRRAQDPEHYIAIGAIASAEVAAKEGDASRATQALSSVGVAGKWVLDTAKEIGVPVLVAALKSSLGL